MSEISRSGDVQGKIIEIIEKEIRPALEMDGGSISFERYENGVVYVQLEGACRGCPGAAMTLKWELSVVFNKSFRRSKKLSLSSKLILLVFVAISLSCATSPLGRRQLVLIPDSQMDGMGVQAFQQLKQSTPVEPDSRWNAYVRCVALPLTDAAKGQVSASSWEIVVFKDDTANAFALPGGKIGVHTGLMKVARNDGQLAAVIGHEIGHVIAKHSNERVSEGIVAEGGLAAIGAVTANNPRNKEIMGLLGVGTQFGVLLPHSRTQESEADLIGLNLMARAGFDPRQSVELWKNMMAAGGSAPPEWLSTHPANSTRIANLQSHIPAEMPLYQRSQTEHRAAKCTRPS